jgi:PKD repeat protein
MLRTKCAAVMGWVAASLVVASAAAATPATPSIAVRQQSPLEMRLSSSTGTHWSWTIVDRANTVVATSAANPMTHTFAAAGDYTALLDATDDDPQQTAPAHAQTAFHVYARPTADFTYAQLADGSIRFTDASTNEPTAWTWTFPGGTFKGAAPPPQTLPVGPSTVTLRVTSPAGNHNVSRTVVVNGPPAATLNIMSSPAAIDSPVLLDASRSTDPNQDALSYSWDLDGDGRFGDGAGALQTVRYAAPGQYRVAVQVSDGHGGVSMAEGSITVMVDQAPLVTFANDPVEPTPGATVTFVATASDPDGTVTRVDWDLDDDGQFDDAAGLRATWSFGAAGRHRVAVRATDDRGVATVGFRSIVVASPALPSPTDRLQAASTGPSPESSAPGVAIPSVPASSSTRATLLTPFPVVRLRGLIYRGSVRISLFRVQAPAGATIRVRCRQGSCARRRPDVRVKAASAPVRVRSFEGRSLHVGTIVEVFVTAPRRIGKYTRFKVRAGAAPARSDLCLAPGAAQPRACPTT